MSSSYPTRAPSPALAPTDGAIAPLLFVSGAVALVYETLWQRQFALVFGSAAPATAAVLGAYFAGLGAGAFVVGRLAVTWSRPLRAYALLEFFVGVGALLVAPILSGFEQAYPALFQALARRPGVFLVVRTVGAFAAILIPTFCMGGTLPLLGQFVDHGRKHLGLTAGWLYVVNTAGAGFGALAFPFLLLPRLGMAASAWLCVAMNGALAMTAWWLDWRSAHTTTGPVRPGASVESATARPTPTSTFVIMPVQLLALISGFVTFALQVLWNRAFAQVHENSMYSFSVIVAVVVFSLAAGAQAARFGLRRGVELRRLVGTAWILGGLTVLVGPWLFVNLSGGLRYLVADGWTQHALHLIGLAMALLFLPMGLLGIVLPAIMEEAGSGAIGGASRVLGRMLAANVLGSVAGALAAGFILPGWLGLWGGVLWLGALLLACGLWQWVRWPSASAQWKFGALTLVGWFASFWSFAHVDLARVQLASAQDEQLVALAEGTHGIVAVVERPGSRRLKDGHIRAAPDRRRRRRRA